MKLNKGEAEMNKKEMITDFGNRMFDKNQLLIKEIEDKDNFIRECNEIIERQEFKLNECRNQNKELMDILTVLLEDEYVRNTFKEEFIERIIKSTVEV